MKPPRRLPRGSDLRGTVRLAVSATAGVADLVEAMHERIARPPGFPPPAAAGRTSGITGLVYKSVRGVTRLVGGSLDALLRLLPQALDEPSGSSGDRDALLAALNGVLGDHLHATANPLATPMQLRQHGRALDVLPAARHGLLVLLHGLCMNDLQWQRNGHDHGQALQRDRGFTPVYVRYNSGRHVAVNGQELSQQLELLLSQRAAPSRVLLLGHSMGGLVARSALHHAALAGHHWPTHVTDLVCLGTPHHGAPLERAGRWVDTVLAATPYAAPFARLTRVRSAGITDLRHGNVADEETRSPPTHVPLPTTLKCYAVAAGLGDGPGSAKSRWLGDGLVTVDSALGRHARTERCLQFPAARQWVAPSVGHMGLLDDAGVYEKLREWLR